MAHMRKRNRTTTSLSLAAIIIALGIEPLGAEAQQLSETPQAIPGGLPTAGVDGTVGGVDGGLTGNTGGDPGSIDLGVGMPPPGQIEYVAPPGSGYIFNGPPPSNYTFEPIGSPKCAGDGGMPLCQDGPVCCPDPNLVHRQICCQPDASVL